MRAGTNYEYATGERVTVIKQGSEFKSAYRSKSFGKSGTDVVGTADLGENYVVDKVAGDWLEIRNRNGDLFPGFTDGRGPWYLNRFDVAPYEKASNYVHGHKLGVILLRRGHYDPAIVEFNKALKRNPTSVADYASRGEAWLRKEDYDKAIADYSEAIRIDPKATHTYIGRAIAWLRNEDYNKAIDEYRYAYGNDFRLHLSVAAYTSRTERFHRHDYSLKAIKYDGLINREPKDATHCLDRGIVSFQSKDYDRATAYYNQAIQIDPNYAGTYCYRGCAWLFKHDYKKAIADFNEAIRIDPKDDVVRFFRRIAWSSKQGMTIEDYNEAIRIDRRDALAYRCRGILWSQELEFDKALADYNEAILIDSNDARTYYNRGIAWYRKAEYNKSIADYSEAIRLHPELAEAWNRKARLLATCPDEKYRNGKTAIELATKACELFEWKDSFSIGTLAAAFAEVRDFENAVKWQTQALELSPATDKLDCQSLLDLYKSHEPYREPFDSERRAISK